MPWRIGTKAVYRPDTKAGTWRSRPLRRRVRRQARKHAGKYWHGPSVLSLERAAGRGAQDISVAANV